jgi:8-oxo-dGTP diphosphatase
MDQSSDFPRPILTVDGVLLAVIDKRLQVALLRRPVAPFEGVLALTGGYVRVDSDVSPDAAALRVLQEKLNFQPNHLEQVVTVGNATRDARGWSSSIVYLALEEGSVLEALAAQGIIEFADVNNLPELAFDHRELIALAVARLKSRALYSSVGAHLLAEVFTLAQLLEVYELLLGSVLNPANFRRKMLETDALTPAGQLQSGGRPAQAYRLKDEMHYFGRQLA